MISLTMSNNTVRRRYSVNRLSWRTVELFALTAALAINWLAASLLPSMAFSYTSLALFIWLTLVVARISPRAAILLLPVVITRLATMLSLIAIESGAYMPEINRLGAAGSASASFALFTAIFFIVFASCFRTIERPLMQFARSELLMMITRLLAWPVIAGIAAWCCLAFLQGLQSGFPLLEGVDRFFYRRYFAAGPVMLLLDNKNLIAALLGSIAFTPSYPRLLRFSAILTLVLATMLYFLFGDKFFTILAQASFFLMPYLLRRSDHLMSVLVKVIPLAAGLISLTVGVTLFIYSGYGRLPMDRTLQLVGERVAGQGELWYIANRDFGRATHWDSHLITRYMGEINEYDVPTAPMRAGVETFFFVQRYAPESVANAVKKNQGWVQFTMGYEAMALVMFGYVGVAVLMAVAGVTIALCAAYLQRSFLSGFPPSMFFAVWTYLVLSYAFQQASLWTAASPGQLKRFLLFFVIEMLLFALNRAGQRNTRQRSRARAENVLQPGH